MQTKHKARVGLQAVTFKDEKKKQQLALGFVVGYNDKDQTTPTNQ